MSGSLAQSLYFLSKIPLFIAAVAAFVIVIKTGGADSQHVYGGGIMSAFLIVALMIAPMVFFEDRHNGRLFLTVFIVIFIIGIIASVIFYFLDYFKKLKLKWIFLLSFIFLLTSLCTSAWSARSVELMVCLIQNSKIIGKIIYALLGAAYAFVYFFLSLLLLDKVYEIIESRKDAEKQIS